eukprot:2011046-Alexandrium_andersonii.AAC.1
MIPARNGGAALRPPDHALDSAPGAARRRCRPGRSKRLLETVRGRAEHCSEWLGACRRVLQAAPKLIGP